MKSIESFLSDLQRGMEEAMGGGAALPASVDLAELAGTVFSAEQRRADSEKRLGLPVPRFCIFSVTWRCNLDCVGCYAANYARGGELSIGQIEKVVRELCALGTYAFVIAGGEPLLVDGLIETLAGVREGLFAIFTNATLLDAAAAEALARAGNLLPIISVDGPPECTDARRGPGVWDRTAAAMAALNEAGMPFGFASMVTHENLRQVTSREWFDRMWDAGARFAFLIDYIPFAHNLQPQMALTDEDMLAKEDLVAQRYAEARPLVMNFPPDEYAGGTCHAAGCGMVHVNADGCVEPCPYSHYAADNVKDKPFEEILASPFLTRIREDVLPLANPLGRCLLFSRSREVREIACRTGAFFTEQR